MIRDGCRVLMIDDEEDDVFIVQQLLAGTNRHYDLEWASSFEAGLRRLDRPEGFDVALVDYRLGAHTGLDLLAELGNSLLAPIPVVLLTGEGEQGVDDAALAAGAADYLAKSELSSSMLDRSIRYAVQNHATNLALARSVNRMGALLDALPDLMLVCNRDGTFLDHHQGTVARSLVDPDVFIGAKMADVLPSGLAARAETLLEATLSSRSIQSLEYQFVSDGRMRDFEARLVPIPEADEAVVIVRDITDQRSAERALTESRKLESIGTLAAGVAHEINTPIQFVSDNMTFLAESFVELLTAFDHVAELAGRIDAEAVNAYEEEMDIDFLRSEVPGALSQSREGLVHVAEIVRAMKDFSHPGGEHVETSLNEAIESTTIVSRNEWKYLADLDLDLDESLPLVRCNEGQIKQVILNIIVNAAHAIADDEAGGDRGLIAVSTRSVGDRVRIEIRDNGSGMSPEVRSRIYDRFFTTKDVGRGTGQGLAVAHDIITSHGGTIAVDSVVGAGTTFVIELPVRGRDAEPADPVNGTPAVAGATRGVHS